MSQIRTLSTRLRNLYGLREIQAVPGTRERRELRRARMDAERMVEALQTKQLALPAFLLALALPLVAALGRATGWLSSTTVATAVGVVDRRGPGLRLRPCGTSWIGRSARS